MSSWTLNSSKIALSQSLFTLAQSMLWTMSSIAKVFKSLSGVKRTFSTSNHCLRSSKKRTYEVRLRIFTKFSCKKILEKTQTPTRSRVKIIKINFSGRHRCLKFASAERSRSKQVHPNSTTTETRWRKLQLDRHRKVSRTYWWVHYEVTW